METQRNAARIDSPHRSNRPLRVAVLSGGNSAERTVSLQSGLAVVQALRSSGHQVSQIDPAKKDLTRIDWSEFDCAFIALHGAFGEDGQVQSILESAGVAYTGSDPTASRIAFSKSAAKQRFLEARVPTPRFSLIHINDGSAEIRAKADAIGYPLVVKPDAQGSSLGVTIVDVPSQLDAALNACFSLDDFGLLEAAVIGSEWTLGLIGDTPLPLIKIETDRGFYDYRAKYQDDATQFLYEFEITAEEADAITSVGQQAAAAIGTRGVARVDIRVDQQGKPWVLEINTIPGFTDHSLVPKAAARAGIEFVELCDQIVRATVSAGDQNASRQVGALSREESASPLIEAARIQS